MPFKLHHNYITSGKSSQRQGCEICKRYVYKVEKVNIKKLFKEIILSDIGGKLDLVSSIYIIDIDRKHIFYLYDDRGLFIYALEEKYLPGI